MQLPRFGYGQLRRHIRERDLHAGPEAASTWVGACGAGQHVRH
jgi:hypothetical protein